MVLDGVLSLEFTGDPFVGKQILLLGLGDSWSPFAISSTRSPERLSNVGRKGLPFVGTEIENCPGR